MLLSLHSMFEALLTKCFTIVSLNCQFHVSRSENKIVFSLIYMIQLKSLQYIPCLLDRC